MHIPANVLNPRPVHRRLYTDSKTRQYPDLGSLLHFSLVRGKQKYSSPSQLRDSAGLAPDFPIESIQIMDT